MRPILQYIILLCFAIIAIILFASSKSNNCEFFQDAPIPKIVHYVYLYDEPKDFNIVYAMSILSSLAVIIPDKIYFWYSNEPVGKWWTLVKRHVTMQKVETPEYIGSKKLIKGAHKADIVRMKKLMEYGGIYLDLDTICVRPIDDMLNHTMVMGKEGDYGLCNAIMFAHKDSPFLHNWWKHYEEAFVPNGWNEASILLPRRLSESDKSIKVYPEDTFFKPTFTETEKIFADPLTDIPSQLRILHLWDSFSKKYYTFDSIENMRKSNSLYGKIVNHLFATTNIQSYLG